MPTAPLFSPSNPLTALPFLLLKPTFSGDLDFDLVTPTTTVTRMAVAAGDPVPSLYAPLFDDPFADGETLAEALLYWIQDASPAPKIHVRTAGGDLAATPGKPVSREAALTLEHRNKDVEITQSLTTGEPFIPVGPRLAFLPATAEIAQITGSAWILLARSEALDIALAPVTRDGRAFQQPSPTSVPLADFNAAALHVPSPLPDSIRLLPTPDDLAPTVPSLALDLHVLPHAGTATARATTFPQLPALPTGRNPSGDLLQATSQGGWQLIDGSARRQATALLDQARSITSAVRETPDDPLSALTLSTELLATSLPALYRVCQQKNIPLHYNKETVEEKPLDVAIAPDVDDEHNIDWFEIRPEITCAGFTIPPHQWEIILKRGYFDPSVRGEKRAPIIISQGTLDRFKRGHEETLVTTRRPKAAGGAAHRDDIRATRLRILDWLNLARAGVQLDLPPAESALVASLLEGKPLPGIPVPQGLKADLRPYQVAGYHWLCTHYIHRFGAVLADDMGLGKTLQTIAFLAGTKQAVAKDPDAKDEGPHLVVLPPTLVFNWAAEIKKFYPYFRVEKYVGGKRTTGRFNKVDVVLTTYDIARRDAAILKKHRFDALVFDEAQAVKNYRSSRSQAVRHLRARFVLCLTGTPLENHLGEYFSIVDLALPGLLGDYQKFDTTIEGNPTHPLLARARPFVLRRTKEAILPELPPKIEQDIFLDLSPEQKELYIRTVAEVREEVAEAYAHQPSAQAAISALAALTRLRQACISQALLNSELSAGPKIDYLITSLKEITAEGHAALVFSQFTRALDLFEDHLAPAGINHVRLDGKTRTRDREKLVNHFQNDAGAPAVFLISLHTGAAGLNLTRASYVFHLDPWWNPAVENQASARAHRFGQKKSVTIQRLLMRHTVEEKMMELKGRKQSLYNQLMAPAEEAGQRTANATAPKSALSQNDLSYLLE